MTRPLRVLVLSPHEPLTIKATAREASVHECHDLADMLGRAAAGAADVAVVAADCAGLDGSIVSRLAALGCPVIGVTDNAAQAEALRRVGIDQIAAGPVEATMLRSRMLQSAATDGSPLPGEQRAEPTLSAGSAHGAGRAVAVWGPPGAPGRTSVARSIVAGAHAAGHRALFLDADCAAVEPGAAEGQGRQAGGLGRACRLAASGRLDHDGLRECCSPQAGGGWQLAGLPDPVRWSQITPQQFRDVLGLARAAFDVVVIDAGQDIRPPHPAYDAEWAHDSAAIPRAAMALADLRLAVLLATPGGVARFAAWWPLLGEHAGPRLVAANRVGLPGAGSRPGDQVRRVLAELGHRDDPLLIAEGAVADGGIWREVAPKLGLAGPAEAPGARRIPLRRSGRRSRIRRAAGSEPSGGRT